MTVKFTERVSIAVTPDLRELIKQEALRRHRNFSDCVRILLLEALGKQEPPIIPDNGREEFEISLTPKEVARLEKLGYDVEAFGVETIHGQLELF